MPGHIFQTKNNFLLCLTCHPKVMYLHQLNNILNTSSPAMVLVRRGTILVRSGFLIPGGTLGQGQWTDMEQVITIQPDITMDMSQRTARDLVRRMDQ